jgi:hypothetical protein
LFLLSHSEAFFFSLLFTLNGQDEACPSPSFAIHPDLKSHTGGIMTYDGGAFQSSSRKQKLNTRRSTDEAELVASDDMVNLILWTKLFMEEEGYEIRKNILYHPFGKQR